MGCDGIVARDGGHGAVGRFVVENVVRFASFFYLNTSEGRSPIDDACPSSSVTLHHGQGGAQCAVVALGVLQFAMIIAIISVDVEQGGRGDQFQPQRGFVG